jgi:hypothetical protein
MNTFKTEITGHLDIFVTQNEDDLDVNITSWKEVLIHGDPEGLKSFAQLLIKLAEFNQDAVEELPMGAREHKHLRPEFELSKNSDHVIVGRLDAKGTGEFYDSYVSKTQNS